MKKIILAGAAALLMGQTQAVAVTPKPVGYQLNNIQKGGIEDRAGLKNGDVVKKVNGEKVIISSPRDALDVYNKFSEAGARIEVLRAGKIIELEVR